MSVEPNDGPMNPLDAELRDALILHFRLTGDAIERVNEAMRALRLSFCEAAAHIGIVTQAQIDTVLAAAPRRLTRDSPGIIESALRRRAQDRDARVWHSEHVKAGPQLILAHEPNHPRSEALRALRTKLLMSSHGPRQANIIVLLSTCAGEGRSQLCAELAIAFAQLGRDTLLVDADLRCPRQHELFGAGNEAGLAQALAHGERPRLLGVEGLSHLTLLTSGAVPPNPLELLSGQRFERMVTEWRSGYDFVIIDSPPVTPYSDGFAVATRAGRVLIVSRSHVTSFKDLKEMTRHLPGTHAAVLGAVINRF